MVGLPTELFKLTRRFILPIYWCEICYYSINCTAGLHLSCLAAGFSNNDEVIVPAQTHVATAHAVEYTGAKPILLTLIQ